MKQVEEEVTKKYVKSEACKQREKEILVGQFEQEKTVSIAIENWECEMNFRENDSS